MFGVFWKIWRALFSCYLRFEIRLFALLTTKLPLIKPDWWDCDTDIATMQMIVWVKVLKNAPSNIFKDCLPHILLGSFLNTLTHMESFCGSIVDV